MIRVLFIGDVSGKPGRLALKKIVPELKKKENIDVCITNIENIAHGRGATVETVHEVMSAGVDFMTAGNHIWRRPEYEELLSGDYPIVRCMNYPDECPGQGFGEIDLGAKGILLVTTFLGWALMNERTIVEPFRRANSYFSGLDYDKYAGILVDFHAEASSEKLTFALYLDGRVSAVLGTHTHIPSADERILPKGTAYINDVGSVGPLNSALWVKKDIVIQQSMYPYSPAFEIETEGEVRFDAVIVDIESPTKASAIRRINKVV